MECSQSRETTPSGIWKKVIIRGVVVRIMGASRHIPLASCPESESTLINVRAVVGDAAAGCRPGARVYDPHNA
jgi:hypothetical protein